jgi:hypothetical protein
MEQSGIYCNEPRPRLRCLAKHEPPRLLSISKAADAPGGGVGKAQTHGPESPSSRSMGL